MILAFKMNAKTYTNTKLKWEESMSQKGNNLQTKTKKTITKIWFLHWKWTQKQIQTQSSSGIKEPAKRAVKNWQSGERRSLRRRVKDSEEVASGEEVFWPVNTPLILSIHEAWRGGVVEIHRCCDDRKWRWRWGWQENNAEVEEENKILGRSISSVLRAQLK